jgi:hypothetical protein
VALRTAPLGVLGLPGLAEHGVKAWPCQFVRLTGGCADRSPNSRLLRRFVPRPSRPRRGLPYARGSTYDCVAACPEPLTPDRHESPGAQYSTAADRQRGWAGLVGFSITERDAPTRAKRERSARCSAAPFVISPDGYAQIRLIWRLFGRRTRPHMPMSVPAQRDGPGCRFPGRSVDCGNAVRHEDRASPRARSQGHCASQGQVDAQTRVVGPWPWVSRPVAYGCARR